MGKHTPGPWNVNNLADDTIRAADGTLVAEVYRNEYEPWNQKLIASAPELLEALIECSELLTFLDDEVGGYSPDGALAHALNAIRKATGEE